MDIENLKKPNDMGVYPSNPPTSVNQKYPPPQPGNPMAPYHHHQVGYAHAHPHQGYPSSSPSFKLYSSPSFNTYGQGPWMSEQNMYSDVNRFGRLMFATMVILIIMMCMLSMVVWFLLHAEIPTFQVESFSVSNFTIENHTLEANWEGNVTILNPNTNLKVNSGVVHVTIIYQGVPLAMSLVNPFCIEGKEKYNLYFKLNSVKRYCDQGLAFEILKDQKGGTLYVTFQVALGAKISSTALWKKENMKVTCDELELDFAPDGSGVLSEESSKDCTFIP